MTKRPPFKLISHIVYIFLIVGCGSDNNYYTTNYHQSPPGEIALTTTTDYDYFALRSIDYSSGFYYTGSNSFYINKENYLVNDTGLALQVYPVDESGNVLSTSINVTNSLQIQRMPDIPQATSTVSINLALSSGISSAILPSTLDSALASNPATPSPLSYHNALSTTIYDSLGNTHELTIYLIKTDISNKTWQVRTTIDDIVALPFSTEFLDFDASGVLDITGNDGDGITTSASGVISYQSFSLTNGASQLKISIDFSPQDLTTTYEGNDSFAILALDQDGFLYGTKSTLTIDDSGLITISSTNLSKTLLGKVALVRFPSPLDLQPEGNLLWSQTIDSGSPVSGQAGVGVFGSIYPVSHNL